MLGRILMDGALVLGEGRTEGMPQSFGEGLLRMLTFKLSGPALPFHLLGE